MKNFSIYILLITLIICSCSKDEELSKNNYFKITTSDGKTFTTSYVNIPIPTDNGTFSCQYNKPGRISFWILIDNNNDGYLDISLPSVPELNTVYKTSGSWESSSSTRVDFGLSLNNTDIDPNGECTSEVVFTSFTYPGLVQGTIKLLKSNGTIVSTGEFNFISK